jgi:hypothetical protein
MKYSIMNIIAIAVILLLISCIDNKPNPVAKNFLTALNHLDFNKAKEYRYRKTARYDERFCQNDTRLLKKERQEV